MSLRLASSWMRDIPIILSGLALFYGLLSFARYGIGPINAGANIDLSPTALPKYALFSVVRLSAAYVISLGFTLVYGYVAAYNARAERFMIPLLDTLQSIPVLSFLPGVMLAMVALFPNRQLGVELGSILLIFTGQVWNMTFSFYASLKNIPQEMREGVASVRLQLVAAICADGITVCGNKPHLEFNDVHGRWLVFSHGMRDVRARQS